MSRPVADLDPIVKETVKNVTACKEFFGPIVPAVLPIAIPPVGKRTSKMTLVAVMYIAAVLDGYREKRGQVFFTGNLYQINRYQLAQDIGCDVDDISTVQTHFVKHGWVTVYHWARRIMGEYRGKASYVLPNFQVICEALVRAKLQQNAINEQDEPSSVCALNEEVTPSSAAEHATLKGVQPPPSTLSHSPLQQGFSPKAPERRELTTEASAGEGSQSRPSAAALTTTGLVVSGAPIRRENKENKSSTANSNLSPGERAELLVELYSEAISRQGLNPHYNPTARDKTAALAHFQSDKPATIATLVATAIIAWDDNSKKRVFAFSSAGTLFGLINNFNPIMAAIKMQLRLTFRNYTFLRRYFLAAELKEYFGESWITGAELDLQDKRDCWENFDRAAAVAFYQQAGRSLPLEFENSTPVSGQ